MNYRDQGAFGKVYKVKKKDNLRIYAMKAMNKRVIIEAGLRENAVIEKTVLKTSKHPFIVNLKYAFQTPTYLYFVMEYIQGGEFFKILQQTKGLPEPVVAFVTAEVVLALEYLNTQLKVIYRDLKPENILLTTTGHVKLTDFGLATLRREQNQLTYTVPRLITLGCGHAGVPRTRNHHQSGPLFRGRPLDTRHPDLRDDQRLHSLPAP